MKEIFAGPVEEHFTLSEMFRVEYYSTLGALFFAAVHNTNYKL
jgi:hypothetical protein